MEKTYAVYILTTRLNTALYTGVTSDLTRRIYEHRNDLVVGFSRKYSVHKLVYYELYTDIYEAIVREKQIKAGSRANKLKLIMSMNPDWRDLYEDIVG
jgi:putative endonuclease